MITRFFYDFLEPSSTLFGSWQESCNKSIVILIWFTRMNTFIWNQVNHHRFMKTEQQLHWNSLKRRETQRQFAINNNTGIIWPSMDGWVGGFVFLFTKKKKISDWVRRILSSERGNYFKERSSWRLCCVSMLIKKGTLLFLDYHLISPQRWKWLNMFFSPGNGNSPKFSSELVDDRPQPIVGLPPWKEAAPCQGGGEGGLRRLQQPCWCPL